MTDLITAIHCRRRQRQSSRRHFHHGQRRAVVRAFTAARLYINGATLAAAEVCGSNTAYVQAATILLRSDNTALISNVLAGRVSILQAAAQVWRLVDLVTAYRHAEDAHKVAFARACGAEAIFNVLVTASRATPCPLPWSGSPALWMPMLSRPEGSISLFGGPRLSTFGTGASPIPTKCSPASWATPPPPMRPRRLRRLTPTSSTVDNSPVSAMDGTFSKALDKALTALRPRREVSAAPRPGFTSSCRITVSAYGARSPQGYSSAMMSSPSTLPLLHVLARRLGIDPNNPQG
jgi:hypothetical protein